MKLTGVCLHMLVLTAATTAACNSLVDAGRYTYDRGAYRDYFVGSFAHNVILIDGGEQQPGVEKASELLPDGWFVTEPDFDYARATSMCCGASTRRAASQSKEPT